ncbi:MAG TPA: hypothetical protein VGI39_07980 [Polyangiaceae bacterium]
MPPSSPPRTSLAPWTWRVHLRTAFAVSWIAGQAALILTASRRADAAFGFRMFAESSTIAAHLSREVEAPSGHGTVDVPVRGGEWVAHDGRGEPRRFRWRDRVTSPNLSTFDATLHAAYSAAAQVERWHAALDDVAAHLPEDAETRGLKLELVVSKNGREAVTYRFASAVPAVPHR